MVFFNLFLIVQAVAFFPKDLRGFLDGFLLIEFDAQYTAFIFSVVDDADILDADIFQGKDRSHSGDLTGFIGNVDGDGIGAL